MNDKTIAKMNKPEMIIFDYGHTLLYEPGHNTSNGNKAIYKYIRKNPHNICFEEFDKTTTELFARIKEESGPMLEIHEHTVLKMAYDYMDIELSVSLEEAEKIIWYGISQGKMIPYADKLLDYLNMAGIRTGVISNLCFSGNALKERIDRFLPNNRMEFILASSEYIFQKPNSFMFEIAMQKANLTCDRIWYCGDSIKNDIYGAHGVGMFPVLYSGETPDDVNPVASQNDGVPIDFDYLHIYDWRELIEILKKMN